jgi:2-oxoglutarate ferredoxin oxidoreductase subunit delta
MEGIGPKNRETVLVVHRSWCKGCGICVAFCPQKVLDLDEEEKIMVTRESDCTSCGRCEVLCPDFALSIEERCGGKPG